MVSRAPITPSVRPVLELLARVGLVVASTAIALFVCDRILGLLEYPTELPRRIAHPAYHVEVRPNVEFQYVFHTNGRGLRYRDLARDGPYDQVRVFVAGDSFTEGVGVDAEERFTDVLERTFDRDPNVAFINGGLAGTGALQYGRLFLTVGMEYDPDALLLCLFVNDVANSPEEISGDPFVEERSARTGAKGIAHDLWPRVYTAANRFRRQRLAEDGSGTSDLVSTVVRVAEDRGISRRRIDRWSASLPDDLVAAAERGRFTGAIFSYSLLYPEYWSDSIDLSRDVARRKWRSTAILLEEILARSEQRGIEAAVVLLPSPFMYDARAHERENPWVRAGAEIDESWLTDETGIQRELSAWARRNDVPFLDLTPAFRQAVSNGESLDWTLDGHWNAAGHRVAADAIATWLSSGDVFSFLGSRPDRERAAARKERAAPGRVR